MREEKKGRKLKEREKSYKAARVPSVIRSRWHTVGKGKIRVLYEQGASTCHQEEAKKKLKKKKRFGRRRKRS